MNMQLQQRCDLIVQNRKVLMDAFTWDSSYMNLAAACLLTNQGILAFPLNLKECDRILKQKTGFLSNLRGHVKAILVTKMSLHTDPEAYLNRVIHIYNLICDGKFFPSEYYVISAMAICDHDIVDIEYIVAKSNEIYMRMKQEHTWLTGEEDYPLATILAISNLDVDHLITEMENVYSSLKDKFLDVNAVQSLSHILALDERELNVKCHNVLEIYASLKSARHKIGGGQELAILGTLSMLELSTSTIVSMIIEADDYLKSKTGFGDLLLGPRLRRVYASQMVLSLFVNIDNASNSILVSNMLSVTISMEICLMMCMTSCITASTSH